MLVTFIADLLRDPKLQQEFSKDPTAAMERAGLGPQERKAVLHRNPKQVTKVLMRELGLSALSRGKAIGLGPQIVQLAWPTNSSAEPFQITPAVGRRGQLVTLTVTGRMFASNISCWLKHQDRTLKVQVHSVKGEYASDSTLVGRVNLRNAPLGSYTVYVQNPEQDFETLFTLANGFEVVE